MAKIIKTQLKNEPVKKEREGSPFFLLLGFTGLVALFYVLWLIAAAVMDVQ